MTLDSAYAQLKILMMALIAVCSLIAGMRIYQGMQKGEPFEGPVVRWLMGLFVSVILFALVDSMIYSNNNIAQAGAIHFTAISYASETYQASLYFGLAVAIVGLMKVYQKFRDGDDDVYDFMIKWFGSLMFLFTMGWIIDSVLGGY